MLRTQRGLRVLGPDDLPSLTALVARNPVVNVFADYRARSTSLDPRRLGGEMWGYVEDGQLVSACHAAANLVPVEATPDALDAFAARALAQGRRCATIVGPIDVVRGLWERLEGSWSPARDYRWHQPHMEIEHAPRGRPRPAGSSHRPTATCRRSTRRAWPCTPRSSASPPRRVARVSSTAPVSPS